MITRLCTDDITNNWELIKSRLLQSAPKHIQLNEAVFSNILKSLIDKKAHVWLGYVRRNNSMEVKNMIVTTFIEDSFTGLRNLLIYAASGDFISSDKSMWLDMWKSLKTFAKSYNCINIIAFSNIRRVISLSEAFGCDVSNTVIKFSLED